MKRPPTTDETHACTYERLERLVRDWQLEFERPAELYELTHAELVALMLVRGYKPSLNGPLKCFLLLDGWLQRWVLEHLGMHALVRTTIGAGATWGGGSRPRRSRA